MIFIFSLALHGALVRSGGLEGDRTRCGGVVDSVMQSYLADHPDIFLLRLRFNAGPGASQTPPFSEAWTPVDRQTGSDVERLRPSEQTWCAAPNVW